LFILAVLKDTAAPHKVKKIREKTAQSNRPVLQMSNPGLIGSIAMTGKLLERS
jgi:hypothetical protein